MAATAMAVTAAVSSVAPVPSTQPPRAQLSGVSCVKALDPIGRGFSMTATMRPLARTRKLMMNVRLLDRAAPAPGWSAVVASGLGQWISPTNPSTLGRRPGDVWNVRHPVADLTAPAEYRFEVEFRWIGSAGKVLGDETLTSPVCQQPELRPDLTVGPVSVAQAPIRTRQIYTTTISNVGATAAKQFLVALSDAGTVVPKTISYLGPHASKVVSFTGPACIAAQPPTITADPNDQVDVYSRAQAAAVVTCPGSASGSASSSSIGMNGTPVH